MNTPVTVIDKDILNRNICFMQTLADKNRKLLMPMMKTHKSTQIARMQLQAGCFGFLCGTIDECLAAYSIKAENIMYAYPISNMDNLIKLCNLASKCNVILRADSYECVTLAQKAANIQGVSFGMTVIVDSGLHRFGLNPLKAAQLATYMNQQKNIRFLGFSTHPGHVYQKTYDQISMIAKDECESLEIAQQEALKLGIESKYITSGSTPTIRYAIKSDVINIFHPGNYVFNDYIQISLHCAKEEDCALYVTASVISNPSEGVFIIDAGAKCLGLDKGAHGNCAITGYGYVKKHPDVIVASLSEEVGILHAKKDEFKIGDVIQIIPNHSCSTANLTSRLYCIQDNSYIDVDIRGNSYNFE